MKLFLLSGLSALALSTAAGAAEALPADPTVWLDNAQEHPGSWWTDWSAWLAGQSGRQIAAPKAPGSRRHPVIEPAPGRYVRQKA